MGHPIKHVQLPALCDTAFAVALHEDITRELPDLTGLTLDAAAVERINTPVIQLLVMLGRALRTENIPMSVHACSAAFQAAFEHLGLGAQLTEWRAA